MALASEPMFSSVAYLRYMYVSQTKKQIKMESYGPWASKLASCLLALCEGAELSWLMTVIHQTLMQLQWLFDGIPLCVCTF